MSFGYRGITMWNLLIDVNGYFGKEHAKQNRMDIMGQ